MLLVLNVLFLLCAALFFVDEAHTLSTGVRTVVGGLTLAIPFVTATVAWTTRGERTRTASVERMLCLMIPAWLVTGTLALFIFVPIV